MLRMFAFASNRDLGRGVDFPLDSPNKKIHSWKNHPNLQRWMEELYSQKDGKEEDFKFAGVELSLDDLELLERKILLGNLPQTLAYFAEPDGEEIGDDLSFVGKAREEITAGHRVYYTSCW